MATIAVAKQNVTPRAITYLWEALIATSLDGAAIDLAAVGDAELTVQVVGTFDSATLTWQGSIDGSTWFTLNQKRFSAVDQITGAVTWVTAAFSAAGGGSVLERPRYIRPLVAGGSGSEDLDAYLHIAKAA